MISSGPIQTRAGKKKKRRTRLLIYPRFQLKLIALNSLVMLGISGLILFQAYLSNRGQVQMGLNASLAQDHAYFKLVALQASRVYTFLGIGLASGLVVSAAATLWLSHRLAGPIVRLRSYFTSMRSESGYRAPLRFRKGDYFSDLPDAINAALDQSDAEIAKYKSAA